MSSEFSNQVVLITGASSGIGRAAALRFGRMGATVLMAVRRKDALERFARSAERQGFKAIPAQKGVEPVENTGLYFNMVVRTAFQEQRVSSRDQYTYFSNS